MLTVYPVPARRCGGVAPEGPACRPHSPALPSNQRLWAAAEGAAPAEYILDHQ